MANLLMRVKRRYISTITMFHADCRFSKKLAFLRAADDLSYRLHLNNLSKYLHNQKDRWITSLLYEELHELLIKYKKLQNCGQITKNPAVWICWWTGEENAPPLVKQCIHSIYRAAGKHPGHLITEQNYAEYLSIPGFMLRRVREGTMGLAHLADYIRVSLLAQYGGLWLDATIFCASPIPTFYFEMPFFTCKSPDTPSRYLSRFRWTTFCLGGQKEHIFYCFLKESFETYWTNHAYAVDYLFFDHLINLAYEHIPAIHDALNAVPVNNLHRDDLQAAMNAALPATSFDSIIQDDTILYKLSWRENYSLKSSNGTDSIFSYFIQMDLR